MGKPSTTNIFCTKSCSIYFLRILESLTKNFSLFNFIKRNKTHILDLHLFSWFTTYIFLVYYVHFLGLLRTFFFRFNTYIFPGLLRTFSWFTAYIFLDYYVHFPRLLRTFSRFTTYIFMVYYVHFHGLLRIFFWFTTYIFLVYYVHFSKFTTYIFPGLICTFFWFNTYIFLVYYGHFFSLALLKSRNLNNNRSINKHYCFSLEKI